VMLGGVASGQVFPEQWGAPARAVDFYDVKGDLQALLALTGSPREYYWRPGKPPALEPGQNAEIWRNEQLVGYLGALHPKLLEQCDLIAPVIVFQLKFDLINIKQLVEFKNFSKFPSVRRDIAVIVAKTISAEAIEKFIIQKAGKLLNNVQIFDVYQGQNIEKGSKSVALAMTFQDATRTLKDDEIQTLVDDLIKGLGHEFNAKLRM
jgi:phenylalanyl-tRNA synthetase beta chain